MRLGSLFRGADVAVDLGTSAIRVASSVTRQIFEVEARHHGRGVMHEGVVTDVRCAAALLGPLMRRARSFGLTRPRAVASAPTDARPEDREALVAAVREAGAAAVVVFPEPLSAAIGAGLDVGSFYAQMVVDIGHGITDAVVLRGGEIVHSRTVHVGCGALEAAVRAHVFATCGARLAPGAELDLLRELRFDRTPCGEGATRVEGARQLVDVDLATLSTALEPLREEILGLPVHLLRELDHELGVEVVESGLMVSGGGALLPGMVAALAARSGLEVRRAAEPLSAVVQGNRSLLGTIERLGAWGG
jgi:rod shape-determining protein MreB